MTKSIKDKNYEAIMDLASDIIKSQPTTEATEEAINIIGNILSYSESTIDMMKRLETAFGVNPEFYVYWGVKVGHETLFKKLDELSSSHLRNLLAYPHIGEYYKTLVRRLLDGRGVSLKFPGVDDKCYKSIAEEATRKLGEAYEKVNKLQDSFNTLTSSADSLIDSIEAYNNSKKNKLMGENDTTKFSSEFTKVKKLNSSYLRGYEDEEETSNRPVTSTIIDYIKSLK